jgi:hypothetical protein
MTTPAASPLWNHSDHRSNFDDIRIVAAEKNRSDKRLAKLVTILE